MEIYYLKRENYSDWNKFVSNSPQGSIFSNTDYLEALKIKYKILVVSNNGKIEAGIVLPKNEINNYSNPMLTKYFGILFSPVIKVTQKTISKQYKIMELLISKLESIKSFDYYFHPEFKNWIPFYWHDFAEQTRYTYRINLKNHTIEEIYKKFHGNLKNDIKNAQKNGVIITENIKFDKFFSIINKTFKRQGSKAPFSKEKLENFFNNGIRKKFFKSFAAIDCNGNVISVCGILYDNKSCYLLLNGIDIKNQIRGANAFLLYETIKYFMGMVEFYDFEGSMLPGVEQFYRRFGGELTPYMKIWKDNLFNYLKNKAKKYYKKLRYGR